ncbi:hypothetical protein KC19_VG148900 [Ceratodon purpureus]|uniref:DUF4283 domain-containing protein n=1 Tax=Ceratodon purpureus TaxID=3225 RepID=A0A8T0HQM3_CERPU|nr:hypothetical protein KC19_VG148900 [Ceratodon purpureus]
MTTYLDAITSGAAAQDFTHGATTITHTGVRQHTNVPHAPPQVLPGRGPPPDSSLACPVLCYRIGDSGPFNPYQEIDGEQLPHGFGRNYAGLLMRQCSPGPKIEIKEIEQEAASLKDTIVIASFLGRKIPQSAIVDWLQAINQKLGFNGVTLKLDMGRGFLFLKTANVMTTRAILAMTPHNTQWGQCIYQEWVPNFSLDYPQGLRVPEVVRLFFKSSATSKRQDCVRSQKIYFG